MVEILIVLGFGIAAGLLFSRFVEIKERYISGAISLVIFMLLFSLGLSIGGNKEIVSNLYSYSLQAILISIFGVFGSLLLARFAFAKFFRKDEE
ncbi:MAG: LysO family transporter [Bacteroidales bacterium]